MKTECTIVKECWSHELTRAGVKAVHECSRSGTQRCAGVMY